MFREKDMKEKNYTCKKCLNKIVVSKVLIKNNKLVCPYCEHTLETNQFIVKQIEDLQNKRKGK